ncbi:hypothetical protein [Lacinutrix sp. MEBiC02404]
MKKMKFLTIVFVLILNSCVSQNDSSDLQKEIEQLEITLKETKQKLKDTENKHKKYIEENKKTTYTEKIKDLSISIFQLNEDGEGLLVITNTITEQKGIIPIGIYDDLSNLTDWIKFIDFDYDGQDELVIPSEMHTPHLYNRIFDYSSLKPKKIFKKSKENIFIGHSESDEKGQLTSIITAGNRGGYEFSNDKSIRFFGACGAACTNREVYQFNNGVYSLKYYERETAIEDENYDGYIITRIENGITTKRTVDSNSNKTIISDTNSNQKEIYLLENLLIYNSHKQIEDEFEKKNVSIETGYYPEGMGEYKYTVLYKNSEKEVEFYWENEIGLKELNGVRLSKKSIWKTKQGITFGTESAHLEKLNGKPFSYSITCSECDAPQERIIDFENGKLSNNNIRVAIYPNASTETDNENKPKYYSNHSYAKNTKVIELFLRKKQL